MALTAGDPATDAPTAPGAPANHLPGTIPFSPLMLFRIVSADAGNIGGSLTHEFQVLAEAGEDIVAEFAEAVSLQSVAGGGDEIAIATTGDPLADFETAVKLEKKLVGTEGESGRILFLGGRRHCVCNARSRSRSFSLASSIRSSASGCPATSRAS